MDLDDKANGASQPAEDEDLNTTAPNPADEWTMPAPVFRKTSGRLPGQFVKHAGEIVTADADAPPSEPPTDSPTPTDPVYSEPKPKSPALKIVVVALALAGMVAFLVVFLTVIYFFFLRSSD